MILRGSKIALLGLLMLWAYNISAQKLQSTLILKQGVLSNGLRYYIYPNTYPKGEAVYRLFIKAGSVYEEQDQQGLAHFLEHMAFNGTKNFPNNTLVKFLQSRGAKFGKDLNAHTSFNETVYKLKLPTSSVGMIDSTITILSDWANGLLLDSTQIEEERGVIFSEWLSKTGASQDANNNLLSELLNNSQYEKRRTIGDTAVIKHFTHSALKAFYKKWYRPDLMAVAVVGDVDPTVVEKMIREKFASIPKRRRLHLPIYKIEDYTATHAKIIVDSALNKTEINFIQLQPKANAVNSERTYTEYLQTTFINRIIKARFGALSFSNQAYENGSASISNFINAKGLMYGSAQLVKNKMPEGVKTFAAHLEQILQYGFTVAEIEKLKKAYGKQLLRRAEANTPVSSDDIMGEIYAAFYSGNTLITPQEEYRLYQKYASAIDSASLAKKLFATKRYHWHYLLSTYNQDEIANEPSLLQLIEDAKSKPEERYYTSSPFIESLMDKEPVSGTIVQRKAISEIDATEVQLSNGIRLIYKPLIASKNRVNISAFKQGGVYALDSIDYFNGLFAASVVSLSGVGIYNRESVSNYLAGNTASARFLIEKARSGIVGSAALGDIETLFQLIYLRSVAAKVDSDVFKQTKALSIQNIKNQNSTSESAFTDSVSYLLNGKDYVTSGLSATTIEKLVQPNKILPVYNKFFANASGYTYVLMSDTTLDYLVPYIEKYIASLPSNNNEKNLSYLYKGGAIKTSATSFVSKGGSGFRATVSLIFQHIGVEDNYPEYELLSNILENVVKMRLTSVIREQLGMVYSISVNTASVLYPAPLSRSSISFSCLPENVDKIINKVKDILTDIDLHPENYAAELQDVKQNLLKEAALNKQKDLYWSTQIRNTIFNKIDNFAHIANYEKNVSKIAVSQLPNVVKKNFDIKTIIKTVLLPKANNQ
jgi:zinc protease